MQRAMFTILLICTGSGAFADLVMLERWVREILGTERAVKEFWQKNSRLPEPTEFRDQIAPAAPHVRYALKEDERFSLTHPGADGKFDTADDHDVADALRAERLAYDNISASQGSFAWKMARLRASTAYVLLFLLICALLLLAIARKIRRMPLRKRHVEGGGR